MKIHNFCAGPSILPNEVFSQASDAVKEINNSGLSLLEISHRSHDFVDIMAGSIGKSRTTKVKDTLTMKLKNIHTCGEMEVNSPQKNIHLIMI